MSGTTLEHSNAVGTRRATVIVVSAVLAVLAVHMVTSWGYIGLYWGDSGRWLYEVDRYAHGARIYRDVYWGFPPLGMWIVGGAARLIGSDLVQVWSITATIAALLGVAYALAVAQLLPLRLAVLAGVTGMALGVAFASNGSQPLVSGMYTPAVPVAALFAFAQLALFLREWRRPSLPGALLVGALGGAGLLAKHDVWFACALLTAATALVAPTGGHWRPKRAAAAVAGFAAVLGAGLAVLIAQHGVAALGAIFTGHGQVQELGGVFLPNLAQAVVELAALGLAVATIGAIAWFSRAVDPRRAVLMILLGGLVAVVTSSVWLIKAELVARQMLAAGKPAIPTLFEGALLPVSADAVARWRQALEVFRFELLRHLIPLSLSCLVLVVALVRRKKVADALQWRLLVVLLLMVLALRSRRMIAFSEWSALMLEVPVYVFALVTLWKVPARALTQAVTLGCGVLLVAGMAAHRRFGFGVGTRRGTFPVVSTARGQVRLSPNLADTYRDVRDLALIADASGTRPLMAFGYSAGHNYLTGRPGIGSLTHGFRMSLYPTPDSAFRVAQAQHDRLILIDNPAYSDGVQAREFAPWRWQARMHVNHYLRDDRPLFEKLLHGCRKVTLPDRRVVASVYDCAPADTSRVSQ